MKSVAIVLLVLGLAAAAGSGFFFYQSQKASRIAHKYMAKRNARFVVGILLRKSEKQEHLAMVAGVAALLCLVGGGVIFKRGSQSTQAVKVASPGAGASPGV